MKNVIIKDGKIYSESFGKVDVFEIVDKIPTGFFVWNIGDNMGHDELYRSARIYGQEIKTVSRSTHVH